MEEHSRDFKCFKNMSTPQPKQFSVLTLAHLPHLTASLKTKATWEQGGVTCSRSQEQQGLRFKLFEAVLHICVISVSDLSVRKQICSMSSLSPFKTKMHHEPYVSPFSQKQFFSTVVREICHPDPQTPPPFFHVFLHSSFSCPRTHVSRLLFSLLFPSLQLKSALRTGCTHWHWNA